MPFSEGVSTHKTIFQELKDETNLGKKRTVSLSWSRDTFFFRKLRIYRVYLLGLFNLSGQIILHWAAESLKGHVEFQNVISPRTLTNNYFFSCAIRKISIIYEIGSLFPFSNRS